MVSQSHGFKCKYLFVENSCRTMVLLSESNMGVGLVLMQRVKHKSTRLSMIISCMYTHARVGSFSLK